MNAPAPHLRATSDAAPARSRRVRTGPAVLGALLLFFYVRLAETGGYSAFFGMPGGFLFVAPSELRFWLNHLMLVVPGVSLLAYGFGPVLEPRLRRAVAAIDAWQAREWRVAGLCYFTLLLLVSNAGRSLVLLDMPFTDDENAVLFGARMVAEGYLRVPILEPKGAFTNAFTYERDGYVSAMDFPGQFFFGALAILTGLGGSLYAIANAAGGVAVAYAAGVLAGPRASILAALAFLFSPMGFALSITSHGHVPSRALLALSVAFAARLFAGRERTAARDGFLLGLLAGLGFLCRPFEIGTLLLPTGAWLGLQAVRPSTFGAPVARRAFACALLGLLPGLLVFAWYNHQITGSWYTQARFTGEVVNATAWNRSSPWERLGFNLAWNAWMLGVFALGVPALVAVYLGAARRAAWSIALVSGIGLALLLSLGHDNVGVHSVGPIHYSECIVPIALLASAGTLRLADWIRAHGLPVAQVGVQVVAYLVVALAIFDFTHAGSLHAHARIQRLPYDALARHRIHNAVVIAPARAMLVLRHPKLRRIGTWVMFYPHPDPFFRDDVLFAGREASLSALRKRFPGRRLYRMDYDTSDDPIKISDIPPPEAQAARTPD